MQTQIVIFKNYLHFTNQVFLEETKSFSFSGNLHWEYFLANKNFVQWRHQCDHEPLLRICYLDCYLANSEWTLTIELVIVKKSTLKRAATGYQQEHPRSYEDIWGCLRERKNMQTCFCFRRKKDCRGRYKVSGLTLSWRRPLSYGNQSTDLQSKYMIGTFVMKDLNLIPLTHYLTTPMVCGKKDASIIRQSG